MADPVGGGRLERLRAAGCAGIVRRLRQRTLEPFRERKRQQWLSRHAGSEMPPVPAGASEPLRPALLEAPFFFDARREGLREDFARRFPKARERLLEQAERSLAGDLAWVVPGGTSDWNRALPGPDRWPPSPSLGIQIGAIRPLGDVRLAWEIGRCTHLVRLAQAAWLTGEPCFAEAAVAGMTDFARVNPPGVGIAWIQPQEVALRAVSWLWVFRLLADAPEFDAAAFRLWLGQIQLHASFVEMFLTDVPVTHNHRLTELAALFVLGTALPVLPEARSWRRRGMQGLGAEVRRQLHRDGPSGEGSTHYHAFVLDSCVAALLLAERSGDRFGPAMRERVAAGSGFLAWLIAHDGTLPAIGDSDAGRAWRLGLDPLDRRDLLAAAACCFRRSEWGAIAGDAPGSFWLTGGRQVPGASGPRPAGGSVAFHEAGFAVARSGFGPEEEIVTFRVGPTRLLPDVLTSHLHADALSVVLRRGGRDLLVDPGSYLYSEGEGWRRHFRGSAAHSCVVIDGCDQTDVRSERFGIGPVASSAWHFFAGDAESAALEAEHPAEGAPRVRRRAVWVRGGTLLLCDEVSGEGVHELAVWLQLPATSGSSEGVSALLRLEGGERLRVRGVSGFAALRVERPEPGSGPGPGWYSPRYGVRQAGTALQLSSGAVALPHRMVTLLEVEGGSSLRLEEGEGGGLELRWPGGAASLPCGGGVRWRGAGAPAAG